ncbi:MAG: DUF63 family protein [Candidatus Nanohaloarchaea archaeon]|nr:DUF63 family protein [Candidatus Nanohaloarchaea archaeon]
MNWRQHRLPILLGGGAAVLLAVGGAAALFPSIVYDRFLWKYLAGPVVADALNQATATFHGITAHRGYSAVSITVYAAVLLYGVGLLVHVLDRFEVMFDERMVASFVPFMVFGGLLRVVEDAGLVPFPWNAALISPVIYVVLTVVGIGMLVFSLHSAAAGWTGSYHRPLQLGGAAAAAVVLLVLGATGIPPERASLLPVLLGVPAAGIAVGLGAQAVAARLQPGTFLDTGIGRLATASQVLDGAVTVVIITFLGGSEKLPLSGFIIDTIHPVAFPAVKLGVALLFLGAVETEEADTMTALMLLVLIAVGLGPGTRNLARAVFGV